MVALTQQFEVSGKDPQRFFPPHHTHRLRAARCSKSGGQSRLRERIYDDGGQLESCSKDPIGFEGSRWHLYCFANSKPVVSVDPSGKIQITRISDTVSGKQCGEGGEVRWEFKLPGRAPCDGYIVQEVSVYCNTRPCEEHDCEFPNRDVPLYTYMEAWKVAEGADLATEQDVNGGQNFTDKATLIFWRNSCGYRKQTGEVRFYCKDESLIEFDKPHTGELGAFPRFEWKYDRTYGEGYCAQRTGSILSIEKRSTNEGQWSFWNGPPVFGPAFRSLAGEWSCCPCYGDYGPTSLEITP